MASLIPSREQWKKWSLPSKVTYIGAVIGTISFIGFAIDKVISFWPPKIREYECSKNTPKEECPLEIDVYGYGEPHSKGDEIDGIIWEDNDVDVRVFLTNNSQSKIQNISFTIHPETHIRKAVQATTVPDVNIFPHRGPVREISLVVKTEDGKEVIMTPSTSGDYIAPAVIVQCPVFLPRGEIKIVTACIALNPVINGQPPKTLLAPRRPPSWVYIDGAYEIIDAGIQRRYHYRYRFPLDLDKKMLKSETDKRERSPAGNQSKEEESASPSIDTDSKREEKE